MPSGPSATSKTRLLIWPANSHRALTACCGILVGDRDFRSKPWLDSGCPGNYIVGMRTRIIRIGNSQGVRIPKLYLQQTGFQEEVELEVRDNRIVISSVGHPRKGWAEAFQRMAEQGDDQMLDNSSISQTSWDEAEWRW